MEDAFTRGLWSRVRVRGASMRISALLRLAWRNLLRRKSRTALAIIGVLLGCLVFSAFNTATENLRMKVEQALIVLQGALVVESHDATTPLDSEIPNYQSLIAEMKSVFGDKIAAVSPQVWATNISEKLTILVVGVIPSLLSLIHI